MMMFLSKGHPPKDHSFHVEVTLRPIVDDAKIILNFGSY